MARKSLSEKEFALSVFRAYGFVCAACGLTAKLTRDDPSYDTCTMAGLTVDHVQPRKHGGTDAQENLQCLCDVCNSKKNGTPGLTRLAPRAPESSWASILMNRSVWFARVELHRTAAKMEI
jgi:hypothetical protein